MTAESDKELARKLYALIRAKRRRLTCREAIDAFETNAGSVYAAVLTSEGHLALGKYGEVDIAPQTAKGAAT